MESLYTRFTTLAAKRDGLEQAKDVIEQTLDQVNCELVEVGNELAASIPTEEVLSEAMLAYEDNYPGIEDLQVA